MNIESVKTIKEFFSQKDFSFPTPPTDKCDSVIDLYENCIKMTVQPDKTVIEKWHDLLVRYANDPKSVKLSRLYESTSNGTEKVYENGIEKEKIIWDTRRGMQTFMQNGYTYAFASNYFARLIFSMAYAGFVPEYDDFKSMFLKHEFPLFSLRGSTECEKQYANFNAKTYNKRFYTQGWYLAHIISVNDIPFYKYPEAHIKEILPLGKLSDWKKTFDIRIKEMTFKEIFDLPDLSEPSGLSDLEKINDSRIRKIHTRNMDKSFTEDEEKIIRAHFLRFIDPINHFLVPSGWNDIQIGKSIGENKDVISFMIKKRHETFGKKYEDFLDLALVNKDEMISAKSLDELGNVKFTLKEPTKADSKKTKKQKSSSKTNSKQRRYFQFNGATYPLNRLALAVVNYYVSQNPNVTFNQLSQIFNIKLKFDKKPLIRKLNDVTQKERDDKRIFLNAPVALQNDEAYISTQWSYDADFPKLQQILNTLNYQVQEL